MRSMEQESGDVLQNLQSAMSNFIDLPATLAAEWTVRMNNVSFVYSSDDVPYH